MYLTTITPEVKPVAGVESETVRTLLLDMQRTHPHLCCHNAYKLLISLAAKAQTLAERAQFEESLQHASEVVAEWPEWKRNILVK